MALLNLEITFPTGFKYPDFDIKTLKKGLRENGSVISKEAKGLVSSKGVSEPGGIIGRDTGITRRAIKAKVSRPGFTVTIKPYKTAAMGKDFYPAFTYYGHRAPKTRKASDANKKVTGTKVAAPRANYMVEAGEKIGKEKLFTNLSQLMTKALDAKEVFK
jgi:hypothetical protein